MTLRDKLSSANLKATHQRLTILAAMEDCLTHLSLKAGLGANDWKEGAKFKVFESVVLAEE